MKKILSLILLFVTGGVCHAEDITIRYNGSTAKVSKTVKDSVNVTVDGACVSIESLYKAHKLTLLLKGKSGAVPALSATRPLSSAIPTP